MINVDQLLASDEQFLLAESQAMEALCDQAFAGLEVRPQGLPRLLPRARTGRPPAKPALCCPNPCPAPAAGAARCGHCEGGPSGVRRQGPRGRGTVPQG